MRTLSAAETVRVASGAYAPALRVSLEDAGGTFRDVDSYFAGQKFLVGVSLQEDVDAQGPTASITLRRGIFEHSLSPLMLSSGTNRGYVPSATPSPAVALYRRVRVEWYVGAVDESQDTPTWTELFVGRIDSINLADGENLTLDCRDANVAVLSDSFFERERLYGLTPAAYAFQKGCLIWAPGEAQVVGDLLVPSTLNGYLYRCTTAGTTGAAEPTWPTVVGATVTDGTAVWTCGVATATAGTVSMEAVLQQMLNDSPVSLTLYAPDATSFLMSPWKQEREPILEAARKVAQLIGWDLRPRYDSAGTYRFQLYKPDRAASSPVRTFAASQYTDVSTLSMGIEDVRNVLRVIYGDSADLGSDGKTPKRKYVQVVDAASVTAYGRRFMEIAEEATSQVDTSAEATALANAALSDLSTPYAALEVEAFFFPWAQVGDLYRFSANNVHFDSDQDLAVVGVSHEAQLGEDGEQSFRTTLTCRGKPSGGRDRWLQWDSRPGVAPSHSLQDSSGGGTLTVVDSAGVAGGAKFRVSEKLSRLAKFDGVEIHVSETSGFTPASSTLATFGKSESLEVQNLVPGKTYYARAVPRQLNAGRIVQGQPSEQVTFTAGYAAPRMLQPGVDYGATPSNGGFEAWTLGDTVPPDAWVVRAGTWGTNATRYTNPTAGFGVGGSGTYSVYFAPGAVTTLEGRLFGITASRYRLTTRVMFYHPTSTPAANSVRIDVEWLSATGTVLSTTSIDLSSVSGQEFVSWSAEIVPAAYAAYGRVVLGRFTSTAASEFFAISDLVIAPLIALASDSVGTGNIVNGAVTSAKLDTNIAVSGTFSAGSTVLATTAGGNVGVGTTSPPSKFSVLGDGFPNYTHRSAGASAGSYITLQRARGTVAAPTILSAGDYVGGLLFSGYDGGAYRDNAAIYGIAETTPGASDMPGALAFSTSADGGITLSERLRINNAGRVGIGVTSPEELVEVRTASNAYGVLHSDGTTKVGTYVGTNGGEVGTKSNHALRFFTNGAARALFQAGGAFVPAADNTYTLGASGARWSQLWAGTTTINTSDERQKTDIAESDLGLDFIEALRPVRYRFKVGQNVIERRPDGENEDGTPRFREEVVPVPGKRPHYGFIAQHVAAVLGSKDFAGFIHDEETDTYGLRYSEFVAPLVKAVQELSARVRQLEKQLAEKESP